MMIMKKIEKLVKETFHIIIIIIIIISSSNIYV